MLRITEIETGNYTLRGNYLIGKKQTFLLCKRKPKNNKPVDYLLQVKPDKGYISSVYPDTYNAIENWQQGIDGVYRFDANTNIYRLEIDRKKEQASIEKEG